MTRFELLPRSRPGAGRDGLFRLLDAEAGLYGPQAGYPPYSLEKLDDERYRITLAVAGFDPEDLDVELEANLLTVSGKSSHEAEERSYLHRGIAQRAFSRSFRLAEHVKVAGATLDNGLLRIDLRRELPEDQRPRKIEIDTSTTRGIARKAKKLLESLSKAA